MKRLKNRNIFILLTIILSLGITLGAVYFMYQYKDSRENELKTGMISLNFTEKSEVINLSSNVPMIDDLGLKSRPYEFTITNTSTVPVKANITLDVDSTTTIKYGAVRYALFINNERVIKDYIHRDNLTLYEVSELKPNEVINCKLYFWIDYYYDYPGEIFKAKIKAVGESIDELQQEAITVTFDADGGTLNTTTKEVYYYGYYGELPTPTKEGYTFMGWNRTTLLSNEYFEKGAILDATGEKYYQYNRARLISQLQIQSNSTYSFYIENSDNALKIRALYFYDKNNNYLGYITPNSSNTFDTLDNYFYLQISLMHIDGNSEITNNDLLNLNIFVNQKINSNTKVVQNENHTLKAIWKENS